MHRFFVFCMLFVLFVSRIIASEVSDANASQEGFCKKSILFKRPADNDHYRVPRLIQLPSGEILAGSILKLGNMRDAGGNEEIRYKISRDDGQTWSDAAGFRMPVVLDEQTSKLWSIEHYWPTKTTGGEPMTENWMVDNARAALDLGANVKIYSGDASAKNWLGEDVTERFYFYPGRGITNYMGQGIQLKKGPHAGRLIMPGRCYGEKLVRGNNPWNHNVLLYSDDHGKTWQWGGKSQGHCGEACIVELSDGSVYMNNRNHDPQTKGWRSWSISRDGGETFTEFGVADDLPEGRCHAAMARYSFPDEESRLPGRVLFLNPSVSVPGGGIAPHEGRKNMTVKLSYDDCKTWPVSKTVHAGKAGYSDMIVTKDGSVLCAFESGMNVYAEDITLVRFNIEWLESGFVPAMP
jgi:sialidase-1